MITDYQICQVIIILNLKNYIYFHLKLENFKKLGWGYDELKKLLNEFLNYSDNVILTKDIENDENLKKI